MTKEYEIVKTIILTYTVYADNDEQAETKAWAQDDNAPMMNYEVYDMEITCMEDEEE